MPTVNLRQILQNTGTKSLRGLKQYTGVHENSAFKQGQIAAIDVHYRANAKPLGIPLDAAVFDGAHAQRNYAGGELRFLHHVPGQISERYVAIRYVGFTCLNESNWDQVSTDDEPYFIIGVASSSGSNTIKLGPYAEVDSGDSRYEAAAVCTEGHKFIPPLVLGCAAKEHDFGTPEEAEALVRGTVESIEKKFDEAVKAFSGASFDDHVMPEWIRDIYIGWVPEWLAAGFGMGDDNIGRMPVVLFDRKPGAEPWTTAPRIGTHGMNDYNLVVPIRGEGQGDYNLFFNVQLILVETAVV